jgi:hydrogenase/urease accessory protein HupE
MHFPSRRLIGPASAFLFLILAPATAEAHSDLRLGPFGAGILHPIETLSHLLTLIALGLLLGRRPPFRFAPLLGIFAPVAALAMLLTLADHAAPVPALLTSGLAVALGALLASGRIFAPRVDFALLALAALLLGLDSGYTNPSALMVAKVLFGNWVCLLVLVGYVAFYTSLLPPRPWTPRAFRVAGSWIVAIGLLELVLSLRAVP